MLLAVATALGVRRVRRFSNCGPHEGWFRRLKGAVFGRQLKRMGCESTEYFGDLEDIRWMIAHGKSIDGSLEIVTHPTLRPDGAIVDGKDRDKLSERILGPPPVLSLFHQRSRPYQSRFCSVTRVACQAAICHRPSRRAQTSRKSTE